MLIKVDSLVLQLEIRRMQRQKMQMIQTRTWIYWLQTDKKFLGVAVGNKKDVDTNRVDPSIDLLASQSKRDNKEKKKATGPLGLTPAIDPHSPGTREVHTPEGLVEQGVSGKLLLKKKRLRSWIQLLTKNHHATILDK